MTLKELDKLTGDELLTYNGMMGNVGKGEIFKIVQITKRYYHCDNDDPRFLKKFNLNVKDEKRRKEILRKREKRNGTISGGSIIIERIDGLPMDKSKWNNYDDYTYQRCCSHEVLKVVKTTEIEAQ